MILRMADAADVGAVRDFLARLSPETAFRRFFTGLGLPVARPGAPPRRP